MTSHPLSYQSITFTEQYIMSFKSQRLKFIWNTITLIYLYLVSSHLTQLQISQLHLFFITELVTRHNITVIVQVFQIITKYFIINVFFTYFTTL